MKYIVSYDLDRPGQDYTNLINLLNHLGALHLQESVWIVESNLTATALGNNLLSVMDRNDEIFVAGISGSTAAWKTSNQGQSNWLKSNL